MRIACIGGGTGLYTLLTGLRTVFPEVELMAIVNMTDNGGSTGRLRDEFGYLPPGDVRRCLVALSEVPSEMRQLMEHRYVGGNDDGLKGHVIGNLLLTAFKEMTGGEYQAIEAMERLLRIQGKVYPVTLDNTHLVAHLKDGSVVSGETNIDLPKNPRAPIDYITLSSQAELYPPTRDALLSADVIVIGPGDLYTSIVPNLLVSGMSGTLRLAQDNGARVVYVVNTMTKKGETDDYTAEEFISVISSTIAPATITDVIINNADLEWYQEMAYEKEAAVQVTYNLSYIVKHHPEVRLFVAPLVSDGCFARHDPVKLARCLFDYSPGTAKNFYENRK